MNPIVTKSDIQKYKQIADTLDDTAVLLPYILEVQNIELRSLLGDALFYDFMEEYFDTPVLEKYHDLANGKTYVYSTRTIYFDGIVPLICYWAYARLLVSHGASVVRFGVVRKLTEHSEPVDDKVIARMISQARSTAKFYQAQVEQFLNWNRTTYPLWGASLSEERRGAIRITRISNYEDVDAEESTFVGVGSDGTTEDTPVKYVSANYTVTSSDSTIVVTTGAADVTIKIPQSNTDGFANKIFRIIKDDGGSGKVIVSPTGELINGLTHIDLRFQHQMLGVQCGVGQILTITPY